MFDPSLTKHSRLQTLLAGTAILAASVGVFGEAQATPSAALVSQVTASAREQGQPLPGGVTAEDDDIELDEIDLAAGEDNGGIVDIRQTINAHLGGDPSVGGGVPELFLGFIAAFAFDGQLQIQPNSDLSQLRSRFLAGFINPDPVMGFHVEFENTLANDAVFVMDVASQINPFIQFLENPVVNATVVASVEDTGGAAGATADVNVSFFTEQAGFSPPTEIFTGFSFDQTIDENTPGSMTLDPSRPTLIDLEVQGFSAGVFATVSPGDTLTLDVTYGLGSDQIPLFDNQLVKDGLDLSIQAARDAFAEDDDPPAPVPLPATGLLGLAGIGALALMRRRARAFPKEIA